MKKMMPFALIFVIVPSVLLAAGCAPSRHTFQVGVGAIDVTPTDDPLPALMGGATALPAESVSQPLFVKAAVISDGERKVAMVTLDILKYPSTQTDLAARQIEAETGIPADHVTITASHTHSGPLYNYYLDPLYGKDRLATAIVEAVKEAEQHLAPVRLGIARTEVAGIAHNRRLLKDGEVWNDWLIASPELRSALPAAGPVDPELLALAFIDKAGKYKAILWNYSAHPNANETPTISADYPGYVQQFVNEKLGYETMMLFLPGASGDINPGDSPEAVGRSITDKLLVSLEDMRYIAEPAIQIDRRTLQIPGRENPAFSEAEISAKWPDRVEAYRESFRSTRLTARDAYETHLTGIRIGEDFAVVTAPAEVFVSIGLEIKSRSPIGQTMVVQQTNGALGYVPEAADFVLKGYETWYGEHSNLSVHAGETIRNELLAILTNLEVGAATR